MKTWMFFLGLFLIGFVAVLATGWIQQDSAVWHEDRIQATPIENRHKIRLEADQAQTETIATTNKNIGKPAILFIVIGLIGWYLTTRRQDDEDDDIGRFPGKGDPRVLERLQAELDDPDRSPLGGFQISSFQRPPR